MAIYVSTIKSTFSFLWKQTGDVTLNIRKYTKFINKSTIHSACKDRQTDDGVYPCINSYLVRFCDCDGGTHVKNNYVRNFLLHKPGVVFSLVCRCYFCYYLYIRGALFWTEINVKTSLVFLLLTLLGLQSRFGDKPLKSWVVCLQNGTAVLKGSTLLGPTVGTVL